jgi:hypothetical protein
MGNCLLIENNLTNPTIAIPAESISITGKLLFDPES